MSIAAAETKKMNQNLSSRLFFAVRLNMGQRSAVGVKLG